MIQKNIYQGNRYIPKIMGVWDNTKTTTYESLSVVMWGGNSYTSKQIVPPGIDILNELYWFKSSDYNIQLANIRDEFETYQEQVNERLDLIENYMMLHP